MIVLFFCLIAVSSEKLARTESACTSLRSEREFVQTQPSGKSLPKVYSCLRKMYTFLREMLSVHGNIHSFLRKMYSFLRALHTLMKGTYKHYSHYAGGLALQRILEQGAICEGGWQSPWHALAVSSRFSQALARYYRKQSCCAQCSCARELAL